MSHSRSQSRKLWIRCAEHHPPPKNPLPAHSFRGAFVISVWVLPDYLVSYISANANFYVLQTSSILSEHPLRKGRKAPGILSNRRRCESA